MDTPGGGLGATLNTTRKLRGIEGVRTVAFVNPSAYSAGAIIAVSMDELYMAPGAVIGDAAPIAVTPTGIATLGEGERAKAASPVIADLYTSAERNGYNPDLLAAMVLHGRVIHALESPAGEKKFVDPAAYADLLKQGYTPIKGIPDPLDAADTLLTIDNRTAERIGLSKGTLDSVQALASLKGWTIDATLAPTLGQRLVQWLNSAPIRGLLVTIFMISMYLSFNTPGHGVPEAVCMTALATLVVVPLMTGYASWLELVLILVGIALIALEIFVLTGTLIPGIAGAVMVLVGMILTFVPRELPSAPGEWSAPSLPSLPGTWAALQTGFVVVTLAMVGAMLLGWWLSFYLPKLPYAGRLVLSTVAGQGGVGSVLADGLREAWPPIGSTAVATTDLRPSGNAEFPDPDGPGVRTVPVVSDSGFLAKGTPVKVIDLQGPRVLVRPIPSTQQL
jgi:membrane-bound serine protease (ClpP class)